MTPSFAVSALEGLTLEQKASLLSGRDAWSTKAVDEAGIPAITLIDGPHGLRVMPEAGVHSLESVPATCFPPAVAVGSSWDPQVAARVGAAMGREARALGVAVVLGPGVNIKRSPLCGRNFEYYSEDPLLSGVLGAAHVQAMQGQGVGASVKHFAANNQETERMSVSADVDERTLREIYLPAFERIVTQARPATVMAAYNDLNGTPATAHHWLLTEVLREEWGFDGLVVSDWGAVKDRVAALLAGLDLQMPGEAHQDTDAEIVTAVREGRIDAAAVDTAAARVLELAKLVREPGGEPVPVDEHHALSRRLAADCVVLLKNDNAVLPLAPETKIAVIGAYATDPQYQGNGSSRITPTRVDAPLGAITELAERVSYAPGFTLDADKAHDAYTLLEEAVEAARGAEVAVVFAGGRPQTEGRDRTDIDIPAEQVAVIRAVAAAAPRTVVVLSNGGVVSLEGWHDDVDAIVEGWVLGQAGGGALADVLFGVVNPSGHLAETIPLSLKHTPAYTNFPGEAGHVRYGEGVMVGYRHYETVDRPVRYPFGHGLSYTTFTTDDLTVEATGNDTATVRATVTNTGTRFGKHVVQVYVATDAGPVRRPVRELRAFTKIALEPGETRTVELTLDRRAFAYYATDHAAWAVAPGTYRVQVCDNALTVTAERDIHLTGDTGLDTLTLDSTVEQWLAHPRAGQPFRDALRAVTDTTGTTATAATAMSADAAIETFANHLASTPLRRVLTYPQINIPEDTLNNLLDLAR